jgi:hypothetical protein
MACQKSRRVYEIGLQLLRNLLTAVRMTMYDLSAARGIAICPERLVDRSVFYTWAIASVYMDRLRSRHSDRVPAWLLNMTR